MAPPSGLHKIAIASDFETPFPPLIRSSTVPAGLESHRADPSHLAPEDALTATSPPRRLGAYDSRGNGSGSDVRPRRTRRSKDGSRSRSRRRKRFQKLLWVKQSYPDNYTDQATFLENLQRNPRLQPYDFWPLVADSTVIVQHVCSVIIFIVCFVGIFQERVSPVSVVGWGSFATFIGWLLWDWWVGQESHDGAGDGLARSGSRGGGRGYGDFRPPRRQDSGLGLPTATANASTTSLSGTSNLPSAASSSTNLLQDHPQHSQRPPLGSYNSTNRLLVPRHADSASASSIHSNASQTSIHTQTSTARVLGLGGNMDLYGEPSNRHRTTSPSRGGRAYQRLSTIKSAILIYFTLLGLSPILKSLTRSTSSDSIWAMSFWLLAINIFFFDYSGSWVGVNKSPPVASLSTNAALMASTVLASRLPSTGQVFSLTLFSIEVFGLFPVFRRYARHRSWRYHVILTVLLVLGAGGGVGMVLGAPDEHGWPWKRGLLGMIVGCLIAALAMGGCSWWLIGLQKYKNEIYGPWDPARPIIISRRHWDDE
ncbi:phosphatidylinositol N-acetylglucosaminyltransferase-domain-containing protein [Diplogelasinospora grovesii]|uniref:Phosphatidylinositol N-acetylglucosaminyltransferase-domain-containing protein n=1 Tax=Diplogelasinospora grovesii TaxID=303347 RepID=A0AAN6NCC3_9PEZI|nr:phosphatidylinositol N-acetylglucosaminyltransferase-domain-containing protein [Diplogelasinospora grovesii]